jgi:hypothetical protein
VNTDVFNSAVVSPAHADVIAGQTQGFTVSCYDQYANTVTCPILNWSSTIGSVESSGTSATFTAPLVKGDGSVCVSQPTIVGPLEVSTLSWCATVTVPNQAPTLDANDQKVNEASALTFSIVTSDPDNDIVTVSVVGLPSGADFNSITNQFKWTPSYTQSGVYVLTFTASDGTVLVDKNVTITVANVEQKTGGGGGGGGGGVAGGLPCESFTYTNWSDCVNGVQSRTVVSKYPIVCINGAEPVLTQTCTIETPTPTTNTGTPAPTTTGNPVVDNSVSEPTQPTGPTGLFGLGLLGDIGIPLVLLALLALLLFWLAKRRKKGKE